MRAFGQGVGPDPARDDAALVGGVEEDLGAHLVGQEVGELLPELSLAQFMEITPAEIARTVHAHPTLNEVIMEAAHAVEGHAIHI